MHNVLSVLFAVWLGSGIVAVAACVLSSRIGNEVDDIGSVATAASEARPAAALRKVI